MELYELGRPPRMSTNMGGMYSVANDWPELEQGTDKRSQSQILNPQCSNLRGPPPNNAGLATSFNPNFGFRLKITGLRL